jgi:hypothetical protein
MTIVMEWDAAEVSVGVSVQGDYELPYRRMRVVLPKGETRVVKLWGDAEVRIELIR